MKQIKRNLKDFLIGYSPIILIAIIGGSYIFWSNGIESIKAIVITLIGIFSPLLAFIYVFKLMLDKGLIKREWLILSLNIILAILTFALLANSKQTKLLLVMDGIFCVVILVVILIRRSFSRN